MGVRIWVTAKGREKPITDLSDKRLTAILKGGECNHLGQFEELLKEAKKRDLSITDATLRSCKRDASGRHWCENCHCYHF